MSVNALARNAVPAPNFSQGALARYQVFEHSGSELKAFAEKKRCFLVSKPLD
jgi:hypothetical protein